MRVHHGDLAIFEFAMGLWFVAILSWAIAPWLGKAFGDPDAPTPGLVVWTPWALPPDYVEFNMRIGAVVAFIAGTLLLLWNWSAVVRVFTG